MRGEIEPGPVHRTGRRSLPVSASAKGCADPAYQVAWNMLQHARSRSLISARNAVLDQMRKSSPHIRARTRFGLPVADCG